MKSSTISTWRKNNKADKDPNNSNINEYFENEHYMELLALKDKQYKSLDSQFKNLNEKHNILQNKFYLLEKDSEEMKRKLAINDNHEKLENIFSKLSSLILATKTDEDLNLEYKERYLIKELFGGNFLF